MPRLFLISLRSFFVEKQKDAEQILAILLRVLIVAMAAMKTYSWKLWLTDRSFPLIPFISYPGGFHLALFILFYVLAIFILLRPLYRPFLILLLVIEITSMLGDEMRWQPWLYQFLFIILAVVISRRKPQLAINTILLILASTYFFSGIQKINDGFLQTVWQKLVLIKFFRLPEYLYTNKFFYYSGYIVPIFEMISGILILLPRRKSFFVLFPICMHFFVLFLLGPFGIRYNMIVLPWNAAMATFIYLIFVRRKTAFSISQLFYRWNIVIAFVWIVMPVAGWLGYWDKFFSSSVYSGENIFLRAYIYTPGSLPLPLQRYLYHSKNDYYGIHTYVSLQDWSMDELKVPLPPENRIFISIQTSLLKRYPNNHLIFHLK